MRKFGFAVLGACALLTGFGCQMTGSGKDRYSVDCVIIQKADGSKWEKCEENSMQKIITVCMHDERGNPYEVEGTEDDAAAILASDARNYIGVCNQE
jgi:hypothetical protein